MTNTPFVPHSNSMQTTAPIELIAFPTETVWGLGAAPTQQGWQALITAKGRDPKQAFQVSCSTPELALAWAGQPELVKPFTKFWPGPLTLVVRAREGIPDYLAPHGWIGLRVPAHPTTKAVLDEYGGRLLTSSLNRTGQPPARTQAEAQALGLAARVIGDGGLPPTGVASTVLRVSATELELLREGAITRGELLNLLRDTFLAELPMRMPSEFAARKGNLARPLSQE